MGKLIENWLKFGNGETLPYLWAKEGVPAKKIGLEKKILSFQLCNLYIFHIFHCRLTAQVFRTFIGILNKTLDSKSVFLGTAGLRKTYMVWTMLSSAEKESHFPLASAIGPAAPLAFRFYWKQIFLQITFWRLSRKRRGSNNKIPISLANVEESEIHGKSNLFD